MKNLLKFLSLSSLIAVALVLIFNFLFPFVYSIKEPYFAVPVELDKKIETIKDLPVRNDVYGDGEFGAKRKNGRFHRGLDIKAEIASSVYASKSGWARSYYIPQGYGNLVVINHPGKWQTRYGHLSKSNVKKFQWVRQGDIIGFAGKTGNSSLTGIEPHLHFEIRYKETPLDPAKELTRRER